MNTKLAYIAIPMLLVLVTLSCQKKQDLLDKAFEGKKFDNYLPQKPEEKSDKDEEEVEELETKTEVIFDRIPDHQKESVFLETGRPGRPKKSVFRTDPKGVTLNFEDAKLYDIIYTLCTAMEVNFIIDPAVKDQTVTISMVESDNKMLASDLLDLVLKLHDLTMIVQGSFIRIVPMDAAEVNPGLELLYGSIPNKELRKEELVMQIIPLRYVKPEDMTTLVKEFMSPSGRIMEEPNNNILILIDKYQFITKVMELIPIFDVNVLESKKMVYYQFAHVDVVDTVAKLQEILAAYGYEADDSRLGMHPIETLNGVLVISSNLAIFKELDYWVKKLDKEAQFEEEQIFIYQVENTTATSIAETMSQLYGFQTPLGTGGAGSSSASNRRTTSPNRSSDDNSNRTNAQQQAATPQQQITGNQQRRNTNQNVDEDAPLMIVDEDNNSLIFKTTKREYLQVKKTLKQLDILPRQVFLEVTVLNVDLNDSFEFGIDWEASNEKATSESHAIGTTFQNGALGVGYTFTGLTGNVKASISAAKAKGYANILQQPHIMAIDNKSATISVGADVPIRTSSTNLPGFTDGNSNQVATSSTVTYRETGVTLSFTPHINANGVIRLEIQLDISSAGAQQSDEPVPISQNNLATELIVRDNQTVVMGGLIFDEEGWNKQSVPLLGRIPLLRHMFSKRNNRSTKSELIVMITPRLVDSEEKSIAISQEFKDKILKEFERFRGKDE